MDFLIDDEGTEAAAEGSLEVRSRLRVVLVLVAVSVVVAASFLFRAWSVSSVSGIGTDLLRNCTTAGTCDLPVTTNDSATLTKSFQ